MLAWPTTQGAKALSFPLCSISKLASYNSIGAEKEKLYRASVWFEKHLSNLNQMAMQWCLF